MNQQVFIPVTDELIYNHPEQIEGPLVPYYVGMECQNWLSIEINPDEKSESSKEIARAHKTKSGLRLVYSA